MAANKNKERVQAALQRSIEKIYPSPETLEKKLLEGKPLRIYLGIDPTSPHLHLGHLIPLLVLQRFQKLGHEIIFLIGDFTAEIGDPTDKLSPRQPLTKDEVQNNLKTFKRQVARILKFTGPNAAKVMMNSRWLRKMTFADVLRLTQNFTVQQMLTRDMFQERLKSKKPIGVHEFLYPLMQGYDSVAMNVDVEVGGNDQTFNMLVGRDLMRIYKQKEKFVIATKLLVNTESGKKLSKTEGSLINLDDAPENMFGKVMALPDAMIPLIAELATELSNENMRVLSTMSPRDAKIKVAHAVVKTIHGSVAAAKSQKTFIATFSKKKLPEKLPRLKINQTTPLIKILMKTGIVKSKSEARRLIAQGGVSLNDIKELNPNEKISISGQTLKIGKRHFFKLTQ